VIAEGSWRPHDRSMLGGWGGTGERERAEEDRRATRRFVESGSCPAVRWGRPTGARTEGPEGPGPRRYNHGASKTGGTQRAGRWNLRVCESASLLRTKHEFLCRRRGSTARTESGVCTYGRRMLTRAKYCGRASGGKGEKDRRAFRSLFARSKRQTWQGARTGDCPWHAYATPASALYSSQNAGPPAPKEHGSHILGSMRWPLDGPLLGLLGLLGLQRPSRNCGVGIPQRPCSGLLPLPAPSCLLLELLYRVALARRCPPPIPSLRVSVSTRNGLAVSSVSFSGSPRATQRRPVDAVRGWRSHESGRRSALDREPAGACRPLLTQYSFPPRPGS